MKEHESDDNKIKLKDSTVRDIDDPTHTAAIQTGTDDYTYLANEHYFTKYWHLLTSDKYDPCNIMEQVYNHTQDTSIGIHEPKLKAAATSLSGKAQTLSDNAQSLEGQLGSSAGAQKLATALKDAASKPGGKGLKELFGDLNGASGFDLVSKANKVKKKFDDVVTKYEAVKDSEKSKETEYNKNNTTKEKYEPVEALWNAFVLIVISLTNTLVLVVQW